MKKTFFFREPVQTHKVLTEQVWPYIKAMLIAGHVLKMSIGDINRTLEQNDAQWPILEAFSKQIQWQINGDMVWMTAEEWKDVLTSAFDEEDVRIAKGLNGGVVMLGKRTSKFTKEKFSDWLEFLHATAALRGVIVYKDDKLND
jgi:hypothetical protein